MLFKRVFLNCDQVADKAEKASKGDETPPRFQLGGCCDYSVGWRLKPCRQTPPFCGSDWRTDWRDPKELRKQTLLCESSGPVLSETGQLLFYQLQPPPLHYQSLPLHMLASHMPVQLVNMTGQPVIGSWSKGSCQSDSTLSCTVPVQQQQPARD